MLKGSKRGGMIKAVIFDFDGVIANSKECHCDSFNDALSDLGIRIAQKEFSRLFGKPAKQVLQDLFKKHKVKADAEKYRRLKNKSYLKCIGKIKLNKGAMDLIKKLHKNYKLAITSNTTIEEIKILIEKNKLKKYFKTIVGLRSTKHHKPHPEPFLKAAERLHVRPKECLVIEDSPYGVEAAKRAGMRCIALLTTHKREELRRADFIVRDLADAGKVIGLLGELG